MVRVIFLLAQHDHAYRGRLIAASVKGRRWPRSGARGYVTEREMVNLANRLQGWTSSVYKFGCAFIHLSDHHDHKVRDPFLALDSVEQATILAHLRNYHAGPRARRPHFDDIVPLLPSVFDKIAGNLECYVKDLESGKDLELSGLTSG